MAILEDFSIVRVMTDFGKEMFKKVFLILSRRRTTEVTERSRKSCEADDGVSCLFGKASQSHRELKTSSEVGLGRKPKFPQLPFKPSKELKTSGNNVIAKGLSVDDQRLSDRTNGKALAEHSGHGERRNRFKNYSCIWSYP